MKCKIKLYGDLKCQNQSLPCFGMSRFEMEVLQNTTLLRIHSLLNIASEQSLVSIVDGHAEAPDYVVEKDCSISIFPPMGDRQQVGGRQYNFFQKL